MRRDAGGGAAGAGAGRGAGGRPARRLRRCSERPDGLRLIFLVVGVVEFSRPIGQPITGQPDNLKTQNLLSSRYEPTIAALTLLIILPLHLRPRPGKG